MGKNHGKETGKRGVLDIQPNDNDSVRKERGRDPERKDANGALSQRMLLNVE